MVTKAQILADLIEKQGYSRRAFAEKAGIPATTLQSMLTRGIGGAAVDNVIKVCRALGITVEQLERMAALKAEPDLKSGRIGLVTPMVAASCQDNGARLVPKYDGMVPTISSLTR